jgi:hypothetical protein
MTPTDRLSASEPALRPTPTPVNVSLGAATHSTPLPTVLRAHLFSVAWLLRSFEGDGAVGGFGVLRLPSWLSEESIGPGALALPDHADGRSLVKGTYHELARSARTATRATEGFEVVGENCPHDSDFDSVQSLPQQHPPYVSLRCVELGGSLGNG